MIEERALVKPPSFVSIVKTDAWDQLKFDPNEAPAEGMGDSLGFGEDDLSAELVSASSWDIAVRYHEFKAKKKFDSVIRQLRKVSAEAVMLRAREVLGSVVHPTEERLAAFSQLPGDAEKVDFDLDETVDQSFLEIVRGDALSGEDLWMSYHVHRRQPVVVCVDTSLSMTGEKLALTAVALAVVLLQFPEDPVGIVAFENDAVVLKNPSEKVSIGSLVERFLDVPAQGYTHLENGLRCALRLSQEVEGGGRNGGGRPASTLLISDGKYTAGRDPGFLGGRFSHLIVLKMGLEKMSLPLCEELAQKGHGFLKEIGELESLPQAMYSAVKDLLRGRTGG